MSVPTEVFEAKILESIHYLIEDSKERIIQKAIKDFEETIRSRIGSVAINMTDYFSIQKLGSDLVIHVKIEGGKNAG